MLERLHRMISDLFADPPTWKNTTRKCKGRYVETLCKPHRIQVLTNKYRKSAQLLSREYRVHLFLIQLCEYVAQLGEGPGEVEVKLVAAIQPNHFLFTVDVGFVGVGTLNKKT